MRIKQFGQKQRPIDRIVGTSSRFNERKNMMSVENEVFEKGVLLYESGNETVAWYGRYGLGSCEIFDGELVEEEAADKW